MMKSGFVTAVGAALALAASSASPAAVLRVPADHATIGAALTAAVSGDTVQVAAGTYFEQVSLTGGVTLLGGYDPTFSTRNPSAYVTLIHGSGTGPAVTATAVGSNTLVDGFKLSGGGGSPGAGVVITGGAPVFSNNEISGNRRAGIAGGVFISGGSTARFSGNLLKDNSSDGSGGAFHIQNSSPVLVGNAMEDNVAPGSGGAIYAFTSSIVCSLSTFSNNRAGNGGGGAIRIQNSTGSRVVDCTFNGCVAAFGGGVFIKDNSSLTLTRCDFVDCSADWSGASADTTTHHGGGVAVAPFCSVTATDCTFERCTAVGGNARGGAIYGRQATLNVQGTGDPTDALPSSYVIDCTSDYRGGGVWVDASTGTFARISFDNCSAPGYGGGMYVSESSFNIDQNLFTGCSADGGGAIWTSSVSAQPLISFIRNNTIFGCSASSSTKGGGITHNGLSNVRNANITGNIISNTMAGACLSCRNSQTGSGNGGKPIINCTTIYQHPTNTAAAVQNSACTSAWGSDSSNRTGDPLFCGAGDFALQSCSAEVGAICSSALPGLTDRGASTRPHCSCLLVSLEQASWGRIKAQYR